MRLENDLINQLENIAQKTSKAAVARNYLNYSYYLIARPDLSTETPDGTQLLMLPKNLVKDLFNRLNRDEQYELGNELGRIFNTNCSIQQITTIPEKISYLQVLGWFDIKMIPKEASNGKNITYYGISAKVWPIDLLHAFLYRMLHNHQYPYGWQIDQFKDLLDLSGKKLEREKRKYKSEPVFKKYPNMIEDYQEHIGGHTQNFNEDCFYYLFDAISIQDET